MDFKSTIGIDFNDYLIENIDIILVSSIPGSYQNQNIKKYGAAKVGDILSKFKKFFDQNEIIK